MQNNTPLISSPFEGRPDMAGTPHGPRTLASRRPPATPEKIAPVDALKSYIPYFIGDAPANSLLPHVIKPNGGWESDELDDIVQELYGIFLKTFPQIAREDDSDSPREQEQLTDLIERLKNNVIDFLDNPPEDSHLKPLLIAFTYFNEGSQDDLVGELYQLALKTFPVIASLSEPVRNDLFLDIFSPSGERIESSTPIPVSFQSGASPMRHVFSPRPEKSAAPSPFISRIRSTPSGMKPITKTMGDLANLLSSEAEKALETGNYALALAKLTVLLTLDKDDTDALENRALVYVEMGQVANALKDLGRIIEIESTNVVARSLRAALYTAAGKLDLATIDIEKALKEDRDDLDSRIVLAQLLIAKEDYDEAAEVLDSITSDDNEIRCTVLCEQALIASRQGNSALALEKANDILKIIPNSHDALMILAKDYIAKGNLEDAKKALEPVKGFFEVQVMLIEINLLLNDIDEARDAIFSLLRGAPDNETLRLLRAKFLFKTEHYEEALIALNNLVASRKSYLPNDIYAPTLALRGLTYNKQGKNDDARADLEGAEKIAPKHPLVLDLKKALNPASSS